MAGVQRDCSDDGTARPSGHDAREADSPRLAEFNFSLFGPRSLGAVDDSTLTDVLDTGLRTSSEPARWTVSKGGTWCTVAPGSAVQRSQGWKLHVSATLASAQDVLTRSLPVLLESESAFKFARTPDHVALLNDRHTSRGHSGKFLTIYPDSDDEAVRLAAELHEATDGLAGPRVLSDRPYSPGSLVHYRYGAFIEQRRFSNDGFYAWVIEDPDGNPVEDRRAGKYSPPPWVSCPFPNAPDPALRQADRSDKHAAQGGVLIGKRFLAREAIRHTNRGGVYRTTDTHTGNAVIVKEARPHVGADRTGRDERDRLRAEAHALELVAPLGLAPQVLALFEQSQHLFLAEELVPGVSLREWIPGQIRAGGWRRDIPQALTMTGRVAALLESAHSAGLILRDFNPSNIMVLPDGQLKLIDLELAVPTGEKDDAPLKVGTPGFSAPEQFRGESPNERADYFSLGATLCFLVFGNVPGMIEGDTGEQYPQHGLAEWLDVRWDPSGLPDDLRRLILELMHPDPRRRPEPARVNQVLATANGAAARNARQSRAAGTSEPRLDDQCWQHAVDGVVGHLLTSMTPDAQTLWPVSCAHGAPDPCSVQHGAAGVLGVLTRCLQLGASGDPRLGPAVTAAGDWIAQRLPADDQRPPGLYFGEAGIAWSLFEAGEQLGADRLRTEALKLAIDLPVSVTNPDITHGTAGIGLTLLHLWSLTGDDELLRKANRSADELVFSASEEADGVSWGTPAEHHSHLAGRRYYGFAHGTAGVGYFLLAAALATGREDLMTLAVRTGDTLIGHAIVDRDVAQWGAGSDDAATAPHWCHGASGIGTFLARLFRVTGHERFGSCASMAARAVMEHSARAGLAQCHGLAGNGDFLLDMQEATGDGIYDGMAHQVARLVHSCRTHHKGRVVFSDERGGLTSSWGDGMTGVLAFLLRLRYRTPRMWMADELLQPSRPT
jgi:tRNA A-37 threonylcarbamoyl transferase component Bud32